MSGAAAPDAALQAAFDATWPSAGQVEVAGFRVRRGCGGGERASSAWRLPGAPVPDAEAIAAVCAQHATWDQPALFAVADGDDALAGALSAAGFAPRSPSALMVAPVARLTDTPLRPVTAFAIWPPLAIQRDLWAESGIGPARQDIIARAPQPKAALLGRTQDRAAGVGFVAVHEGVAMVHALAVLPEFRRRGLAGWMLRAAGFFAREAGADRVALAVLRENPAGALYAAMGFETVSGYRYFARAG